MQKYSVILGSASAPILDSKNANLSLTLIMAALVKAFSTLLIQTSILALSKGGRSGFLVKLVMSRVLVSMASLMAAAAAAVAVADAVDCAAISVSWTNARMASASMAVGGNVNRVDGDGEGDLAAASALKWLLSLGVNGRGFRDVTHVLVDRLNVSASESG